MMPANDPATAMAIIGPPLAYTVRLLDVDAHLFEISICVTTPDPLGQELALPAWTPGSYMIREFARHVVAISAHSGRRAVKLTKVDKHRWRAAPCRTALTVRYQVYAYDQSVRAAYLDGQRGFLTGSAVFLRVLGQEHDPLILELSQPTDARLQRWQVATTLPRAGVTEADPVGGCGQFYASNYETLVDHPIEFGTFDVLRFNAGGSAHTIAIAGKHDTDGSRLVRDLERICATQARLFEPRSGRAPFEQYLFLINAVGDGYGGLEHRSSTALLTPREALPYAGMKGLPKSYRGLLGLASHEYFHSWHVKRIRPQALIDADPGTEAYTRLLWIFEGFTSYYDDLTLVRAGLITHEAYLAVLADNCAALLKAPGRKQQSLAESSFDAWVKYYRQDENSPNTIVSYYGKGSLVALAIDLSVRLRTAGKRSLDDVMRLLWKRFGKEDSGTGLSEEGFAQIVEEATGLDLRPELQHWVDETHELPLAELLAEFGVAMHHEAPADEPPSLGLWTTARGTELLAKTVLSGGPAMRAGLAAADVLVAMDGLRITEANFKRQLARKQVGERVTLTVFRRDELLSLEVTLEAPRPEAVRLTFATGPAPKSRAAVARQTQLSQRRSAWLGKKTKSL